jgi:hypothetical protein
MWALGFARKGKIVCENANQFSCSDFFYWQIFSKPRPEKYDFFPYEVVVLSFSGHFLPKYYENFGKMCFSSVHVQLFYPFWGKRLPIPM